MRVNLNLQNDNTYNQNFKMRFVENQSIGKYIDSFHFAQQKNNIRKAVDLIKTYVERNPDYGTLSVATLHPSKANYVKNGTYDEFFTSGRNKFKKHQTNTDVKIFTCSLIIQIKFRDFI